MARANGILLLLVLLILSISTVFVEGRYSRRKNRRGNRGGGSYSRQRDTTSHSTRSCSSSSSECRCENRPYELKTGNNYYGIDDTGYGYRGPIERTVYGEKQTCFHYTVARIEGKYDLCSDKSLKSVIIGLDPAKASCKQMGCSGYQHVVASMKCTCGCGRCCSTSIASDRSLNIYGVKFTFEYSIDTSSQEIELEICLKGSNHQMLYGGGLVAFSSTDTTGFACDAYNIPNFCDGMLIYIRILSRNFYFLYKTSTIYILCMSLKKTI